MIFKSALNFGSYFKLCVTRDIFDLDGELCILAII